MIKLFLDDLRNPPSSDWIVFRDVNSLWNKVVDLAYPSNDIRNYYDDPIIISLDHDLGDDQPDGCSFLDRLELAIGGDSTFRELDITLLIHSMNPEGRREMESAIKSIYRLLGKLEDDRQDV